jgi:hypothetical protein
MFCSACGCGLTAGLAACPRCGAPMMSVPPPSYPGFQFELANYASKMRALSTVWFIYGALALVFGIMGMAFADAWISGRGPWMHGPWAHGGFPFWFGPTIIRFGWMYVIARSGLALMAGWGLMERRSWGRIVAIIAAFANLIKFPFGTALGVWTLLMLLGYRNNTLYDRLTEV